MKRKVGTAMVVGAGIAGIRAALDLAEYGYGVTLVDRAPHIGGILSQLDYQFPTDHCGMCQMLPLVQRDAAAQHCLRRGLFHENIDILLSTEVTAIEGDPGTFRVTLKQQPSWVDPGRCVGCGRCVPVCPVEVRDGFNAGLATRKAIYLPVPHNTPNAYVVDTAACTRCGACAEVCPTDAIRMPETERKKFRILVVDDELVVRDSLKEWLEEEGYTVAMAASGTDALAVLETGSFHLMLLDVKMPGMDGVEVLELAKSRSPDLTVVMMTAYATVETAVAAMKIGAMDYLIKPFEMDSLLAKVVQVYRQLEAAEARQIETGAVVLCGGTDFYDPAAGKNTFGYRIEPNVLTQVEFERLLSGTGPTGGRLVRLSDGRPVRKIAWIQCVGSRDVQLDADFCSNICCMVSIKEAVLAKERAGGDLETAIFFMDMRTFGKTFQRFRDDAEHHHGVRFERARAHSVVGDPDGGLRIRWTDPAGACRDEPFDMAVLAVGQRPAHGSADLAGRLELPLNPWGFIAAEPFSLSRTRQPGIFVGGAFGGMKDIGEAVIQASAAAANASRVIHTAGGSLALEESAPKPAGEPDPRAGPHHGGGLPLRPHHDLRRGCGIPGPRAPGRPGGVRRRGGRESLHRRRTGAADGARPQGGPQPPVDRRLPAARAPAHAHGSEPGMRPGPLADGSDRHRPLGDGVGRGAIAQGGVSAAAGRGGPAQVGKPRAGSGDPCRTPGAGRRRGHCGNDRRSHGGRTRLRGGPGGGERAAGRKPHLDSAHARGSGRPGAFGRHRETGREASPHPGAHPVARGPCPRRGRRLCHRGGRP